MPTSSSLAAVFAAGLLLLGGDAYAQVEPSCQDTASRGLPEGWIDDPGSYEQAQQDYIQNYYALVSTFSPVHAPVPHKPGHGAFGVDLGAIPPLPCHRRLVLSYIRSVDSNRSLVLPRLRMSYSFPAIGRLVPYVGAAYLPPIKLFGTTNVVLSGEFGVAFQFGEVFQIGGRWHMTTHKTVADIATNYNENEPAFDDMFNASTFGGDLMVGFDLDVVTPYLAGGFTDASTFFFLGDEAIVLNNFHPYLGPNFSVGIDSLTAEHVRVGAEFYAAIGGYSLPDVNMATLSPASRYGKLYTARLRIAYEL